MCGIFGAVSLGTPFTGKEFAHFVRQTDSVSYRGPNASGYLALNSETGHVTDDTCFDIFLGHRRLSIIDLSEAGRQPMTDGQGRWIIFNGEIFNYVELRDELQRAGHQFHTATDTEVILKIYEVYGEGGFDRLNGMWAFVLVDLPRRRVLLSRDRFSIKPLYYTSQNGRLFFGSEIKQLLPFIKERSINREVMHKFLAQAVADHTNQTFFEHIVCVRPKHTLVLNLATGHMQENQYWEYHFSDDVQPDDAVEQFRELFVNSVKLRLRSDVPIGALVSGGLDSSSIAVVTNKILGIQLQTYSVVARDPKFSEEPFVDALAREGMASHRFVVDVDSSLTALDRVIYHNDEPFLGFHAIAQFQILEAMRKQTQITVVLSGQGGDECLLGYSKFFFFYLQELLRQGRFSHAAHLFWSSLLLGTTVRQFKLTEARRYLPWRALRKHPPFLRIQGEPESIGRADSLRMRQILDLDRYSVPVQTHFEDRNSMAHSLEMRTPFLDHRLVELALNLPVSLKLRSGWTKYVLRAAFPELPDAIRWRRDKKGFITPEELWLRTSLQPTLQQMFSGSALQELGIVDDRYFLEYYTKFLSSPRTVWYSDISRVMIAERWARIFLMDEVSNSESIHISEPTNRLRSQMPAQA